MSRANTQRWEENLPLVSSDASITGTTDNTVTRRVPSKTGISRAIDSSTLESLSSCSCSPPRQQHSSLRSQGLSPQKLSPQRLSPSRKPLLYPNAVITTSRLANAFAWMIAISIFVHQYSLMTFEPHVSSSSHAPGQLLETSRQLAGTPQSLLGNPMSSANSGVIHIIHTRYMQHQPHLIDLGKARLELLKAFTLASLEHQTSQNYLWVIRTDPFLNATLKESLLEILQNHSHHMLIASNENPNIQIEELLHAHPSTVWSGNVEFARQYLEERPNHVAAKVLETRLDADDALHKGFVKKLQSDAVAFLEANAPTWRILCSSRHAEWQYHAAWDSGDAEKAVGALVSLRDRGCISAGLTVGYTEGTQVHELPPIKHDQLPNILSPCKKQKTKCLDFIDLAPTALRARTPTSAGMLNILFKVKGKIKSYEKGARTQEHLQVQLWQMMGSRFGFTVESAARVHEYLETNMHAIAIDNLNGQCTSGHSCKDSAKALLQTIIDHPDWM